MRIRKLVPVGLMCLVAVLMLCADAQAQRGEGRGQGGGRGFGPRGGFGGPLALVQREDVQRQLQLTAAQVDQIETLQDDLRPERGQGREAFENFRDLSPEEQRETFARIREQRERQQAEAQAKLKEILNTNQAKRLAELEIQFAMQRLRTDDQLAVLATFIDESKLQAAMGEPFEFERGGFGGGFGRGGRGDRAGRGDRDARQDDDSAEEDASTSGRRGRRGG